MSKRYNVLMVSQQYSPVCLIACTAMIIQFKRGYTPSITDLGLQGPDFRQPWTVEEEAANIPEQMARLRRLGFSLSRFPQAAAPAERAVPAAPTMLPRPAHRPPDLLAQGETAIESLLVHHGPFILIHNVGAFWYGPTRQAAAGESSGGPHAVVITGIDTRSHTVYFNNPWGDRDVPTTLQSILNAVRRWESVPTHTATIAYL